MSDRLDVAARMVRAKHTMSEIAAALGVTRNTVAGLIGRARQAGDPRFPPARYEGDAGRATRAKLRQTEMKRAAEDTRLAQPAAAPPGSAPALVTGWRRRQCRWIDGDVRDGNLTGCPHDAAAGQPYCAGHLRRAWKPADEQARGAVGGARAVA